MKFLREWAICVFVPPVVVLMFWGLWTIAQWAWSLSPVATCVVAWLAFCAFVVSTSPRGGHGLGGGR